MINKIKTKNFKIKSHIDSISMLRLRRISTVILLSIFGLSTLQPTIAIAQYGGYGGGMGNGYGGQMGGMRGGNNMMMGSYGGGNMMGGGMGMPNMMGGGYNNMRSGNMMNMSGMGGYGGGNMSNMMRGGGMGMSNMGGTRYGQGGGGNRGRNRGEQKQRDSNEYRKIRLPEDVREQELATCLASEAETLLAGACNYMMNDEIRTSLNAVAPNGFYCIFNMTGGRIGQATVPNVSAMFIRRYYGIDMNNLKLDNRDAIALNFNQNMNVTGQKADAGKTPIGPGIYYFNTLISGLDDQSINPETIRTYFTQNFINQIGLRTSNWYGGHTNGYAVELQTTQLTIKDCIAATQKSVQICVQTMNRNQQNTNGGNGGGRRGGRRNNQQNATAPATPTTITVPSNLMEYRFVQDSCEQYAQVLADLYQAKAIEISSTRKEEIEKLTQENPSDYRRRIQQEQLAAAAAAEAEAQAMAAEAARVAQEAAQQAAAGLL
ncbi:MAG: hypothetical protein LBU68_03085 [Rickettsiales bacterium]|jgi:hypothetical protein|nr:hypothetical protein [Rickettsiales bacterium]